ncbi:response regulator transcription factor [Nocardioides mangrovi]|uniref:Response regulator n=1 Tax=Nocardioides mangrovi TaxID=2874580 RepID=A0ABS7UAW2_9ACTN|nr:response regulator [Nocardioides mangrovi]MBZ5738131.1 response regulator [Nocardioides mangrovi]
MSLIVVADDEPELGDLLGVLLTRLGHEVVIARSGTATIEACATRVPDLVLLDVGMPGELDGLEVTRRLRAQAETSRVPILLLTARGSEDDVTSGFAAGASDYLVKPFGAQDVRERVTALLEATS